VLDEARACRGPSEAHSGQKPLLYRPNPQTQHAFADDRVPVAFRRYPGVVKHSVLSTTPTAETPALSDEERAERRRRLVERVFSPDGLDRDTLEHISSS
jgi:hypothetical protein